MYETPKQVIDSIISIGRKRNVSRAELLSALNVGWTESRFSNSPKMTDADSQGWRQERASLYKDPTNLKASINRYFNETGAAIKQYGKLDPVTLADKVQRGDPQYTHRWTERLPESVKLLDSYGGATPATTATPDTGGTSADPTREAAKKSILINFLLSNKKNKSLLGAAQSIQALPDTSQTGGTAAPSAVDTPAVGTSGLEAVKPGQSYTSDGATYKVGNAEAPSLVWWHKGSVAVPAWIVPQLLYAKSKGWDGRLTSGWRGIAEQTSLYKNYQAGGMLAAPPGQSHHAGTTPGSGGAIDVADPQGLVNGLKGWKKGPTLVYAGKKDNVHFSIPTSNGSY